ncbi:DUF6904 family protein (plasmid) [Psychrobium sp. nBUS_13]|uniref:DUF6904 family protein n=1 Tax=Psychrobium sp. nBUS_13 TaxID=3395319 RepID=UPI003EBF1443
MLKIENGKRNGGFVLWGDYDTLKEIHSFCMNVSEKSPILDSQGLIPALAYDLRKAYEKRRELSTETIWDDQVTIYGVEQVWVTFIVQLALMRTSLAFFDTNKKEQSIMYKLEAYLEEILPIAFPKQHRAILAVYSWLVGTQEQQIQDIIGSRVSYFLSLTKPKRANELEHILKSLDPVMDSFLRNHPHHQSAQFNPTIYDLHSWDTVSNSAKI